jgi:Spy/CpxP family protein refolding chaperone
MKSLAHKFVLATVALLIALPLCAAEGKKGGKKGGPRGIVAQLKEKLEGASLTEEQNGKVKEVFEKYTDKIADAEKAIPAELKKSMGDARKKAVEEGKKGKELEEIVRKDLTDDQKAALGKLEELGRTLRQEIHAILTPEQRDKIGLKVGGKKSAK